MSSQKLDAASVDRARPLAQQDKAAPRSAGLWGAEWREGGGINPSWTRSESRPLNIVQRKAAPSGAPRGGAGQDAASGSLPEPVQAKMERSFGTSFSDVEVHEGPESATLGARAFTQGNTIHFSPGEYSPHTQSGQELIGHELSHVVQQRSGLAGTDVQGKDAQVVSDPCLERSADEQGARAARGLPAGVSTSPAAVGPGSLQRKAVQLKLSKEQQKAVKTGLAAIKQRLDKASIPDEVVAASKESLTEMDAMSYEQVVGVVSGLSALQLRRLLQDAPDDARTLVSFTKSIIALGPAKALDYGGALGGAGLFDWVTQAAEKKATLAVLVGIDPVHLPPVMDRFSSDGKEGLLTELGKGSALLDGQKRLLKVMFGSVPDGELALLGKIIGQRFNLEFSEAKGNGQAWDTDGLRRVWSVLEALPPAHVEKNKKLDKFARYADEGDVSGAYTERDKEASIGYNDHLGMAAVEVNTDSGDPLYGANRFDTVVRHEVGHAVDAQIGFSTSNAKDAKFGAWEDFGGNTTKVADKMIAASAGAISALKSALRRKVAAAFVAGLDAGTTSGVRDAISALGDVMALPAPEQAAILGDPAILAASQAVSDPWYQTADGGAELGGRIFQRSYPGEWTSYDRRARARKVSKYQFRAPQEWFAEAYACYYEPSTRGEGARLLGCDPDTKKWMDRKFGTRNQ